MLASTYIAPLGAFVEKKKGPSWTRVPLSFRLVLSPLLAGEHLTNQDPAGHQRGAHDQREQQGRYYHPLLAAEDCWTAEEQSTAISGSKANSMPPGSKSLPSSTAYCRNVGALLKLPELPNCRAG